MEFKTFNFVSIKLIFIYDICCVLWKNLSSDCESALHKFNINIWSKKGNINVMDYMLDLFSSQILHLRLSLGKVAVMD